MGKKASVLSDQSNNIPDIRNAIGDFLVSYVEGKNDSQERLFTLLQSKRDELCSSHDVELILPFVIRIFEFTHGAHLKTTSQLDVVTELYTQLKTLSNDINTIALQLKISLDQYESHAHQAIVLWEIKMSGYINRVRSIFGEEGALRIQEKRSTLYQTLFSYFSQTSSRDDVVAAMHHFSVCIDELGLDAITQGFRGLLATRDTSPDMGLKDFVFTVFRERMYDIQEVPDHKAGLQQEARNLKKLLGQIFHQHVNLQYDEPCYYLPQGFQQYFSPETMHAMRAQHSPNDGSIETGMPLTKEQLWELIEVICRYVYKIALHDNQKSALRMGAYLKKNFFSYLASAIPGYALLERKIPSRAQTFDDIFPEFFRHIQRTDSSIAKMYTDKTFKGELTHQLVSGLLRMEVSDGSAVDTTLHATYGTHFSIDTHMQDILKKKNISLMDFTVDMLALDTTDIKVLLYAMLCPKKHTDGDTAHPLPSPDDLYTLLPREYNLNSFLLTEKGCRYISRAFNAAIDRHCFHSYGLHAGEVYANKILQKDLHIDGSSYPYVFRTTDDVLAIFAGVYHGNPLGAYDAHHLSEYLGVMRCFLHISAWQGLSIDRAASQNLTSTYEGIFSTELYRQNNVQSFSRDTFPKLDLLHPNGKRIEFETGVNDRRDTRQFNDAIVGGTLPVIYSGRVKGLTSSVKKMVNDPQYKRLAKIGDTIANRFEVTRSDDLDDVLAVFCCIFVRLCDTGGVENISDGGFSVIRIKGSRMLKLIKNFLDSTDATYRNHILEKAGIDTELSIDQITVLITQLQKRYDDAVSKSTNGIINGKTGGELDEIKFVRREGHEYVFMHYGAEKRGYLFHAFYNLKKVIDSDLRVNNHIHRSQVIQSMRVELTNGVKAVASGLMKLYSDNFIHMGVVEYAIKKVLMQQIINDYYGSLTPIEHPPFFDDMEQRAYAYREDISQVYAYGNSIPGSLLDYENKLLDKRLLHLMAHIARQRVDYQLDDYTYGSTKVDVHILNTYVHLYQYRKKSTKKTTAENI